ncbi:DEAD/DEAH box helicase [Pseudomonas sp. LRF_L74]|uniref:DEAD/DEAH box helicase n=1 Tax=Pseudomonas sp. LRF_L74 TaxID=3369422 RepID=UPI003F5F6471
MTLDILKLRIEDWRSEFGDGDLRRGLAYARERRSRLIALDGNHLKASCSGSADAHYRQSITLHSQGYKWGVVGHCTCPVGTNCKHVVAALVTLEERQRSGLGLQDVIVPSLPITEERLEGIAPRPILKLASHVRMHYDSRRGRMQEQTQHRAALVFDYAGHEVFGKPARDLLMRNGPTHNLRLVRDGSAEAALRRRLEDLGLQIALRRSEALPESAGEPYELANDAAWLSFTQKELPTLREAGWEIRMQPDFHFNLAQVDDWYAHVDEEPAQDWFELELGIEVDGQQIDLLPILLQSIRRAPWLLDRESVAQRGDEDVLLAPLPHSNRRIALPFSRLRPLLATLGELYLRDPGEYGGRLRIARADVSRLAALDHGPTFSWQGGEKLRDLARRLQGLSEYSARLPSGLQAQLRDYQAQGVAWMQALGELGFGGILADDMGLGKTLQVLTYVLAEKQAGRLQKPVLIVLPTSLVANWEDEARRFTPQLEVLALHGSRRRALFKTIAAHDLVLTTYALLPRDLKALAEHAFHLLILDEAQNIKNPRSKAALAAAQLKAGQRLCLSGTPLENHLGELWSLFNFINPGWLGDAKSFTRDYRTPIERGGNQARMAQLVGRIRPFILRRTKEQVATELPAKIEITQWVELTPLQRDRYETLRLAMDKKVRAEIARLGLARSQIVLLEALLRLRQSCCDLRLLEDEASTSELSAADSGKLSVLLDMLEELTGAGRRVLLFSQFTRMLGLIEKELQARGIGYTQLTGSTRDRRTPVREFQEGQHPVFLISLKAGGAGLNLTAADTVIHFDPWWNPASEAQASDRAYRIGQDKQVFVYRLLARGSVEEKIQHLQQAKAGLARGLLEGGDQPWRIEESDIEALFAPLG